MLDTLTTFEELDKFLGILKKHGVMTWKDGEKVVQLTPVMPEFDAPAPSASVAGGWKRDADLSRD